MTTNTDWDDLLRAERDYYSARESFFAKDPIPALRAALEQKVPTPPGRDSALRVVRDYGAERQDVVMALVPELFEYALDMSFRGDQIRTVLSRLDIPVLQSSLPSLVDEFIRDPSREAADYWVDCASGKGSLAGSVPYRVERGLGVAGCRDYKRRKAMARQ